MFVRSLTVAGLLVILTGRCAASGGNVAYSRVSWNRMPVHVVSVNLNSPDLKVTVSLARNGAGSSESFTSMVSRLKPAAAITGTFFCTKSLLPTGDIVIGGAAMYTGSVGTGVCITPGNKIEFVPYAAGHRSKWEGYETVLCAGPTLVRNGRPCLSPRDQGFRDPALFGKKKRTAIGVTANNKLLLVAVSSPVQFRTLAKMMMSLGAVNAVALDGGSSSALHCNGKLISRPGRKLTNLLVVYGSLTDYYHHRQGLAPGMARLVAEASKERMIASTDDAPKTDSLVSGDPILDLVLPARYEIGAPSDAYPQGVQEAPTGGQRAPEPPDPQAEADLAHARITSSSDALAAKTARRAPRAHDLFSSAVPGLR